MSSNQLKSGDLTIKTAHSNEAEALQPFADDWIQRIGNRATVRIPTYSVLVHGMRTSTLDMDKFEENRHVAIVRRNIPEHARTHKEGAPATPGTQRGGRHACTAENREDRAQRLPLWQKGTRYSQPSMRMLQTVAHILLHCRKHKDRRNQIFDSLPGRHNVRKILNEPQLATKAIKFMEQTRILGQEGDQRRVDKAERWGETVGIMDGCDKRGTRLYET